MGVDSSFRVAFKGAKGTEPKTLHIILIYLFI